MEIPTRSKTARNSWIGRPAARAKATRLRRHLLASRAERPIRPYTAIIAVRESTAARRALTPALSLRERGQEALPFVQQQRDELDRLP